MAAEEYLYYSKQQALVYIDALQKLKDFKYYPLAFLIQGEIPYSIIEKTFPDIEKLNSQCQNRQNKQDIQNSLNGWYYNVIQRQHQTQNQGNQQKDDKYSIQAFINLISKFTKCFCGLPFKRKRLQNIENENLPLITNEHVTFQDDQNLDEIQDKDSRDKAFIKSYQRTRSREKNHKQNNEELKQKPEYSSNNTLDNIFVALHNCQLHRVEAFLQQEGIPENQEQEFLLYLVAALNNLNIPEVQSKHTILSQIEYQIKETVKEYKCRMLQGDSLAQIINTYSFEIRAPIIKSAEKGYTKICELLFNFGGDLNIKDKSNNNTALNLAVLNGHYHTCQFLIEQEVDVNNQGTQNNRPLHQAALTCNIDIYNLLIQNGADINGLGYHNRTPLHFSVLDQSEATELLIDQQGIQLDHQDIQGNTPLYLSLYRDNFKVAQSIIQKGVNVNLKCESDWTSLHLAAQSGQFDTCKLLLDNGAQIDAKNDTDQTPIGLAIQHYHKNVFGLLAEKLTIQNVEIQFWDGRNALGWAAYFNLKSTCQNLSDNVKAQINAVDSLGQTALHQAAKMDYKNIFKYLQSKNADMSITDVQGNLALHYAAMLSDNYICSAILKKDMSIKNVTNNQGQNIMHIAAENSRFSVIDSQISKAVDILSYDSIQQTPFTIASRNINTPSRAILIKLIDQGCALKQSYKRQYVNRSCEVLQNYKIQYQIMCQQTDLTKQYTRDQYMSLLYIAILADNLELFQNLKNSQDISLSITNIHSESLLHLAILAGSESIYHFIISQTQNQQIDKIKDVDQDTLLHTAVQQGHTIIVQDLIKRGVNLECRNSQENTPLLIACRKGHIDILNLLIENKANTNVTNKEGANPLHSAAYSDCYECCKILLEKDENLATQKKIFKYPFELASSQKVKDFLREQWDLVEYFITNKDEKIHSGLKSAIYIKNNYSKIKGSCIVKAIFKAQEQMHYYLPDCENLRAAQSNENIVRLYDIRQSHKEIFIVMEKCDYDLQYYYTHIANELSIGKCQQQKMICQLAQGLNHLHSIGIQHQDIRPENILIKDNNAKISDFGYSKRVQDKASCTFNGQRNFFDYSAPEIIEDKDKVNPRYTYKADVCSFGMIVYYILTNGKYHLYGNEIDRQQNIMHGRMNIGLDEIEAIDNDYEAYHLICITQNSDIDRRPSMQKIIDHCYFWSDEDKLDFICKLANQLKTISSNIAKVQALNELGGTVFEGKDGWNYFFDECYCTWAFKNYDGSQQQYFRSLKNLVVNIRHFMNHFQDQQFDPKVRYYIEHGMQPEPSCNKIWRTYSKKLPKLLMVLYYYNQENGVIS